MSLSFRIELELEDGGRWIAEVPDLAGALCYGATRDEAIARVQALALRVLAERLDHAEAPAELLNVSFLAEGSPTPTVLPFASIEAVPPTEKWFPTRTARENPMIGA